MSPYSAFIDPGKIIPKDGVMEKTMDILVISRAKTKFINSVSVSLSVLPNSQGIHYYQSKPCELFFAEKEQHMADEMITAPVHPTTEDSDGDAYLFPHDDVDDDDALPAIGMSRLSLETSDDDGYLFQRDDEDGALPTIRMSRLSIETSDGEVADGELSDKDPSKQLLHDDDDDDEDDLLPPTFAGFGSLPGTPTRRRRGRRDKEYRSDGEARGKRREQRRGRDWWVEREWERRRRREQGIAVDEGECQLLVRRKGRPGCICMDIDEVKACRELGIELQPCDWTVGFSGSAVDTSSGGNSPIANWRISSPGDDPKDVKARLKMWAHAVALASSTSFSG